MDPAEHRTQDEFEGAPRKVLRDLARTQSRWSLHL